MTVLFHTLIIFASGFSCKEQKPIETLIATFIFCAQKFPPPPATGDKCKNYTALKFISSKLICELHREVYYVLVNIDLFIVEVLESHSYLTHLAELLRMSDHPDEETST
jgi:hypothetical protein